MRITAGSMRGRLVPVADVPGLRPTPSKVRQALFNIIGSVEGLVILDLYAGSGIMALEALSRGASTATSIEQHQQAIQSQHQTRQLLQLSEGWIIQHSSVEQGLTALAGASFDLIFADPPYAQGEAEKLPLLLDQHSIACGQLIIEESSRQQPIWPQGWASEQSRRYGDSCLHFLARAKHSV